MQHKNITLKVDIILFILFVLSIALVISVLCGCSSQAGQNASNAVQDSRLTTHEITDVIASTTQEPPENNHTPQTISVHAVGDMMFSRYLGEKIETHGGFYPFKRVAYSLQGADIILGNVENPLWKLVPTRDLIAMGAPKATAQNSPSSKENKEASSSTPTTHGTKTQSKPNVSSPSASTQDANKNNMVEKVVLIGNPKAAAGLKEAGFTMVTLANNHLLDGGIQGLKATLENLDAQGIAHTGAGLNMHEAMQPVVQNVGGTSVAYLGICDVIPKGYAATASKPGIAPGRTQRSTVLSNITKLKKEHDIVLVSIHWGTEYSDTPTKDQISFGHACIDAGATALLCHHPHVLQGFELYKGHLIAYSLGDFIFDIYHSNANQSVIAKLEFAQDGSLVSAKLEPIIIDSGALPRKATSEEGQALIERLHDLSAPFNTQIIFDNGVGVIQKL